METIGASPPDTSADIKNIAQVTHFPQRGLQATPAFVPFRHQIRPYYTLVPVEWTEFRRIYVPHERLMDEPEPFFEHAKERLQMGSSSRDRWAPGIVLRDHPELEATYEALVVIGWLLDDREMALSWSRANDLPMYRI